MSSLLFKPLWFFSANTKVAKDEEHQLIETHTDPVCHVCQISTEATLTFSIKKTGELYSFFFEILSLLGNDWYKYNDKISTNNGDNVKI